MCQVLAEIHEGLVPTEKVARVQTADGRSEEITLFEAQVIDDEAFEAAEIGREGGKVLIELPRESASGRWRLWVYEKQVRRQHVPAAGAA